MYQELFFEHEKGKKGARFEVESEESRSSFVQALRGRERACCRRYRRRAFSHGKPHKFQAHAFFASPIARLG